ncbi:LysR family transcriptional regulator [Actinoplanes ianthinogenes]|uniref:LysR family transcriptional regulator n=1 Tax=Actinoplanes ianthinogenes TaxID=122358 RepID=A0ABM7M6L4_9ACTN|nr:LysR family transcriptional regulator [Actinoplanes ianthinogenes]BCJ47294.1 LysR family transcriptional regulator [Actinoplanes ianthinogenes]GGR42185.1 LysR family transcriptional regulator [Actinoplanes ianthinogenes]
MELRDIEIFLTLAEELHFGRTAQRLFISQARVSQSISTQERHIGAALFERTSRVVRLTPLGVDLRDRLQPAYRQLTEAIVTVKATVNGARGVLTLGTMGAIAQTLGDTTDAFRTLHPGVEMRFKEIHPPDPFSALRGGDVDVDVAWLPIHEPDLTVGPILRSTPVLAMVGRTHPFADRKSIDLEELADCTVLGPNGPIPRYMEDSLVPFATPTGRPIPRGPRVGTFQEVLTTVASGTSVALTQAEAADYYQWPDIVYVPIADAPPSQWAVVWRTGTETSLIRDFASVVAGGSTQP